MIVMILLIYTYNNIPEFKAVLQRADESSRELDLRCPFVSSVANPDSLKCK
jgi:hypothetical protein